MATINIDSASSGGRYLRLQVTEQSVNARNNTSVVSWILFSTGDSYPINVAHNVSPIIITINGTEVYRKGYTSADTNAFPATAGQTGGTLTVTHNSNGAKTITCKLEGEVDAWVPTGRTKDLTLTNIDRSAPTVSMAINSITDTKISFTMTVSTSCDLWQYSLNDGTWTTFYSTNTSTAQTYTITGLSPNTSYTLKVRARKYSNYVYGSTSNASFSTYGGSLINSVNTVTADASTVSITYSATVYNSDVTHTLELKNGSTTILTFSGISVVSGNNTITLSSSQRTTLLNAMSTIKSFTGTFVLRTYVGSTEIGSGTSRTATVQTTATNSTPTFSGFTYQDGNSDTVAVTGNNQILIQNKSSLMITCSAATAKNGASISSYSVSAGSVSKSSTSTSINVGLIPNTGTVPVTVTAIDSRGYSKSVTVNVTVLAYNDIAFTQYSGRRENEIENTIQVAIQGSLTALTVSNVNKNTLVTLRYRYKETSSSSWTAWYNVTSAASVTSSGFTYNNNYLVSLDSEKSWNIEFNASDKLTSDTIALTITQGIPLISYRPKKVGINYREPTETLEVGGSGRFHGQIKTSFKQSVATGSLQAQANTIPDLVEELRYSSGCCGSVNITTAYSLTGDTISAAWYNFLWIPHRSGGINGNPTADNCNYGACILSGMTGSYGTHILRFSSGTIAELRRIPWGTLILDTYGSYAMTANTWVDTITHNITASGYYMIYAHMTYSNSYPIGIAIYYMDGTHPMVYSMDVVDNSNTTDRNIGYDASVSRRYTSCWVYLNAGTQIRVRCKGRENGTNTVTLNIQRFAMY